MKTIQESKIYSPIANSPEKASRSKWTEGMIFNLPLDVGLFLAPLILPIAFYLLNLQLQPTFWVFSVFMSAKLLIDSTHLTATLYAAVHRAQIGQLSRLFIYSSPMVILVAGSVIMQIDSRLFFSIVVYWSLVHFVSQQYGFVMMSRAKSREPKKTRWMDAAMVFNLVQYPIVYLHSSSLKLNRFMGGEFILQASQSTAQVSALIFWSFNAIYLGHLVVSLYRSRFLNIGKLIILLNTGLVYYGCLVYSGNFWLWAACLGLTHGLPYIGITYQSTFHGKYAHYKFNKDGLGRLLFASSLLYLPIVLGLALYLRRGPDAKSLLPFGLAHWLFPFYFLPSLLHYYLDSFIWKNPAAARRNELTKQMLGFVLPVRRDVPL